MGTESSSECLHRLDTRAHHFAAPEVEEEARPSGRVVIPEALKVFLEQVGSDGTKVVFEQIAQTELLGGGEIDLALQQTPARLLEKRLVPVLGHAASFGSAHFIQGIVHFRDDVKAVEDVESLGAAFADNL